MTRFLRDLWQLRLVARRLFMRHLAEQYRYSSLGLLWAFAPSLLTAAVLMTGQHHQAESSRLNNAFYGVFGICLVQTFLEALNATRRIFSSHQDLLRRIPQSLDALVAAAMLAVGFDMIVRLSIIVSVFILFSIPHTSFPLVFVALLGYLGLSLIAAGLGLLFAPASALTSDIDQLSMLLPWGLMATTPVFFPPSPASLLGRITAMNPLTWLFDGIRASAYGGSGSPIAAMIGFLVGCCLFGLGWYNCRIFRPHIVERILR